MKSLLPRLSWLLGALWGQLALRRIRRELRGSGRLVHPLAVPRLGPEARWGLSSTLRRGGASCLESSLALQAWDSGHGQARDVVIGVAGSLDSFRAHAWLEGAEAEPVEFQELVRWPALRAPPSRLSWRRVFG